MCDEAHIRLVDAHAEGDGRHHYHGVLTQKARLMRLTPVGTEAGMIRQGVNALIGQPRGSLINTLTRQAIHNAGRTLVFGAHKAQ